jgi:uncharacterized membrane protein YfcA
MIKQKKYKMDINTIIILIIIGFATGVLGGMVGVGGGVILVPALVFILGFCATASSKYITPPPETQAQ